MSDITQKIKHGINYGYDTNTEGVIEIPGKFVPLNHSDGHYNLLDAKNLDWNFVLDELKNINIEVLNKYRYKKFYDNPENKDKLPTYKDSKYINDDKFVGLTENDDQLIEEIKNLPLWYPSDISETGSINSTYELLDLINFILFRAIYLDEAVEDILNRFNRKTVKLVFSENVDEDQDGTPNQIIDVQIHPILKDGIEINESLYFKLTVGTLPGVSDSNFQINCTVTLDGNVRSDVPVPVTVTINEGSSISSDSPIENKIWNYIVNLSGFNNSVNEHTTQLMFWSEATMNINAVDAKGFYLHVTKTPNKIKSVKINDIEYIYFEAKEIYNQIKSSMAGSILNNENILYYPCLIEKKLLEEYSGSLSEDKPIIKQIVRNNLNDTDEEKYVFRPSNDILPGYINWFLNNNHIYVYPLYYDNNNFQYPSIFLENGVTNTIEIIYQYNTDNCVCKLHNYGADSADITNDYVGYYDKPYEYKLSIPKNLNKTDSEILNMQNNKLPHNNFEYIIDHTGDAEYNGKFIFKLLSQDLDNGNIDKSFVMIFETTGTKYLESNYYPANGQGLHYVYGSPLALKFKLTNTEKLYVLPYSELSDHEKNKLLYDLEDYPISERLPNKNGSLSDLHDFLGNSKKLKITDDKGVTTEVDITPFRINIPIINTTSFGNWQNILDRNYKKSYFIIWDRDDLTTENYKRYLFNVSNASNIIKHSIDGNGYYFEDKNLILNNEIEIDYLASWHYLKFYDEYKNLDIPMIDTSDKAAAFIKNALKTAKTDEEKAKALINLFIDFNIIKNDYGDVIQKRIECKQITSIENKYYFEDLYSDKYKFFIPIVFKIPGKSSGSSILYKDSYFAMHLTIYRGKRELKVITHKTNSNSSLLPIDLIPQENIDKGSNSIKEIPYSYIFNSKTSVFEGENEMLSLICKSDNDDKTGPYMLIGNTIPESTNSNFLGGFPTEKTKIEYEIDGGKKVILSIDNKNKFLYCDSFYTKYNSLEDFNNDRWRLGKDKTVTFYPQIIITTDAIYHADTTNVPVTVRKNTDALTLNLNKSIFSETVGNDFIGGNALGFDLRNNNTESFEKIVTFVPDTSSMIFTINDFFIQDTELKYKEKINHYFKYPEEEDSNSNIYKTEIKFKFVENDEDYQKFFNIVDYTRFENIDNPSDVILKEGYDDAGDKKISVRINNLKNHLFKESPSKWNAYTSMFYLVICIFIPQTPVRTAKYYYIKLSGACPKT